MIIIKINLRTTSVQPMITFLQGLKTGQATRDQLIEIFNHPDYDYEFRRYQSHGEATSKEQIIDYFYSLPVVQESDIPALRPSRMTELRDKHALWLHAYNNPQEYEVGIFERLITDDVLKDVTKLVEAGLPDDVAIDVIDVVVTLSIGGSFGYVYDGAFHIDLLRIPAMGWEALPSLLAHESHHVAMMNYESEYIDAFTLEEWFIHFFSGEGLAVKFCNNAQGTISKPIYENRPVNEGLDSFTMTYLNEKFDEALDTFHTTLAAIRGGRMTKEDVWKHLMTYWFNFHTDDQQCDEAPKLQQSLAYSFGNDFYGAIYDAFGKSVLFSCVRHPLKAVELFNSIFKR